MNPPDRRVLRSIATFGIAFFGPLTLLTGILTFVTIPRGVPSFLAGVFVFGVSATTLSVVAYLVAEIQERYGRE